MTITPISSYPRSSARPPLSRSLTRTNVLRSSNRGSDHPEWSLELDIRVHGEPDPAVVALLSELRRLVSVAPQGRPVRTLPAVSDADITIDTVAHEVRVSGRSISTTRLEFDLLLFLAENPARVFTRRDLLDTLWPGRASGTRTIDVHVRRLRAKTGRPLVTTVRNVGYRLAADARTEVVR